MNGFVGGMGKEIVFYYDIICPYAYLASKLIKDVAQRNGAKLVWRPVLLGGIYKSTKLATTNIPDNKLIKSYSDQKRRILAQDLAILYDRYKVPISAFKVPDIQTLNAMRLIASTPSESDAVREKLTHVLFDAIWLHQNDVSDLTILQGIADSALLNLNVNNLVNDKLNPAREILVKNTEEAVKRGAFGVPSMWVNNRLYFGSDRLFMVENELGNKAAKPHRLLLKSNVEKAKLTVFLDFSSPWTYLAMKQIPALLRSVSPVEVDVEYVPVVVGVIFRDIGTPMVPLYTMGENKRNYQIQDFNDWLKYYGIKNFQFSSHFPLRTLLPLRVSIVNPEFKMMENIMDAIWCENKNVSDEQVLSEILSSSGYDAQQLLKDAQADEIKLKLRQNTQRGLDAGICGVPSFQINDGPVVFGQDRMNVLADMLLGWKFGLKEKLQGSKL
ncbi:uncharacterized protein LOC130635615 isoform X2 [Hydractinia symbiolongicarpus]|uniref:uncharacterized protein LOC130635615 isoform X2 n=1 Tax=Hydractinia symbiolongicarpus TaxID=13093 RepID=UPI00254CBF6D|nr:uncharacterized protein LOC130635615 isoform X2 [Hydractinia symbiolongicarpus]